MYELAKATHLVAMIVWMAGMLLAPILIVEISKLEDRQAAAASIRAWYLRVFSPAMIVLWVAGIVTMTMGGWFTAPWMIAKLALVLLLSGVHGALSGQMRRLATEEGFQPWAFLMPLWGTMVTLVAIITVLAVYKP
ncbi:MAG: CopD family protein [Devosiaceae bacterium]|nr:CopD family protein [Devosiaceae bacterium MH13]